MPEEGELLDGKELRSFQDQILAALIKARAPEEEKRGVMHWYKKDDAVGQKVLSALFTTEQRDGQLWAVVECQVSGTLTPMEMDTLMDYLGGQMSDGWGEGFEQREICVNGRSELYVHLWQGENWSIMTEQDRFDPHFSERLPEMCLSVLPSDGTLICVIRGEQGYHSSEWNTGDPERNRRIADYHNQKRGITTAQEQAMVNGSIFGWDIPSADPKSYEKAPLQMGGLSC